MERSRGLRRGIRHISERNGQLNPEMGAFGGHDRWLNKGTVCFSEQKGGLNKGTKCFSGLDVSRPAAATEMR